MTVKTTVSDICTFMDNWAPQGWAYPWDRVGLHTGDPQQHVEHLMVCLSVTQEAVATAIRKRVSMIVAHHPLIWNPIKHCARIFLSTTCIWTYATPMLPASLSIPIWMSLLTA